MKKPLIVTLILIFCCVWLTAQPCLPDGIEFNTQAQIDSFQINFPGCTEIGGNVNISYLSDIANLDGLNVINSIGGDLEIKGNNLLTNLVGLDSLTFIGGNLWLYGNDSLVTLTGLENLTSIGGFLGLGAEDQGGNVGNPVLFSLSALAGLSFVGDAIYITGNNALVSLAGLEGVTSIDGRLVIFDNLALASLTGLQGITSIGGDLYIADNDALTSLEGLENIDAASIDGLVIRQNDVLSTCEVLSVCDYLKNPSGWVSINNNAIGCNSSEEVLDSCEANAVFIDEHYIKNNLVIYPNPATQELNISVEGLTIDEVAIYTLTGQQVLQVRPVNGTVDISRLQPGMYIVEVMIENTRIRQKLLVQR